MERLQAAIEKARAQRQDAPPPVAGHRPDPEAAVPAPDTAPSAPAARAELWASLSELQINPKRLHRNRITTLETGPDSAPYDMLRTRMLQQARHNGWKRIAIVSPHSNCGKSTTTANLAFSLARQKELYSLVLDMDLRRSGLTRMMGQHGPLGMSEVLERKAGFADQAQRHGTNVAFGFNSGTKVHTPSEILQSRQTKDVLDEISTTFAPDVMLFDMPALFASDDNFGFLQNVDCALILVAAEKTPMSQIDIAERHVAELTNVMGIVLNKCRYATGAYGHEYDYY